jgi:D-glycero-alpha-D-manno-heptose 1-phosphate guanylyltransferase
MIPAQFDDVTVVVLAGGRGTRIQSIYPDTPKPMVPVLGKPFLHWLTLYLGEFGPRHFVYSTGYRAEQIEAWCADGTLPEYTRETCREGTPLGTGGGLINCLDLCRDWLLVANGDGLCLAGLDTLLALRGQPGCGGGLLGVAVDDTSRYGSLDFDADNRLQAFREKVPGRGYINSGFYLFRRDILERHRRDGAFSIEQDLFPALLADGVDLRVVPAATAAFIDIGTPETLSQAESFVGSHLGHLLN